MAILLTESAANRVKTHLAQRGIGVGLRVGIKKTGCSGFAYVVNYADQINPEDAVFEARGVKVVVDPQSLPLIDGTLVDFVRSEEHTSELQSQSNLVCRLLLEK